MSLLSTRYDLPPMIISSSKKNDNCFSFTRSYSQLELKTNQLFKTTITALPLTNSFHKKKQVNDTKSRNIPKTNDDTPFISAEDFKDNSACYTIIKKCPFLQYPRKSNKIKIDLLTFIPKAHITKYNQSKEDAKDKFRSSMNVTTTKIQRIKSMYDCIYPHLRVIKREQLMEFKKKRKQLEQKRISLPSDYIDIKSLYKQKPLPDRLSIFYHHKHKSF